MNSFNRLDSLFVSEASFKCLFLCSNMDLFSPSQAKQIVNLQKYSLKSTISVTNHQMRLINRSESDSPEHLESIYVFCLSKLEKKFFELIQAKSQNEPLCIGQ